tara:strand:- start:511 stop:1281 length:771 start_codon:yes stop_codon:yes gene_type:complete
MKELINRQSVNPKLKYLPIFHSCDGYFFRDIIKKKTIEVTNCPVFKGEKLNYFFYGRPAFKSKTGDTNSKLSSFLPCSFILDIELLDSIKRISPFDTGGFERGFNNQFIHHKMKIENFLLEPDILTTKKIITLFYDLNINYVKRKPKIDIKIDSMEFEAESYHAMIVDKGVTESDDRKETIELQSEVNINLETKILKAVVVPSSFIQNKHLQSLKKKIGFDIIHYDDFGQQSVHFYSEVLKLTREFMMSKKVLEHD